MEQHGIAADRPAGGQPLPVRGDGRGRRAISTRRREHRHRRPGDDPLGGQEPRALSRWCVDPADYRRRAGGAAMPNGGATDAALRKRLAAKAFARTAAYDAAIAAWFAARARERPPPRLPARVRRQLAQPLRYGENPHQRAALLSHRRARGRAWPARASCRARSCRYNNIDDTDAAFELVGEFAQRQPAVAIIKHANPCGVALGATLAEAYAGALALRPGRRSAASSRSTARSTRRRREAIARDFHRGDHRAGRHDGGTPAIIAEKKNLRLLVTGGVARSAAPAADVVRSVAGGLLVQDRDTRSLARARPEDGHQARSRPPRERADLLFAFARRQTRQVQRDRLRQGRRHASASAPAR